MKKYDVAIFGAGLVGGIQALLLAKAGCSVLLAEVTPEPSANTVKSIDSPDLRVSAITLYSEDILNSLDIMRNLNDRFGIIKKIYVWDWQNKSDLLFDSTIIGRNHLCKLIENNLLLEIINNKIKTTKNIFIKRPFKFESIDYVTHHDGGYTKINGDDGDEYYARLIIGADGANSTLRNYFGFDLELQDYNHHALVTTIYTEKSHHNTAYQVFLEDGPLAFLPWQHSHCCSIVWSQSPANADYWLQISAEDFNNKLSEFCNDKIGRVIKSDMRLAFPVVMRHVKQYHKKSCVLIGDAAHTIHPLAGQGLNLGIYDAKALADCLILAKANKHEINSGFALRKYELERRGHNQQMINFMEFLKYIYSNNNRQINFFKNFGLKLINKTNVIKKQITKQAAGYF